MVTGKTFSSFSGVYMVRSGPAVFLAFLMVCCGCTSVTEQENPGYDTLLVGTSFLPCRIEIIDGVTLHNTYIDMDPGSVKSIAAIPDTTSCIAVIGNSVGQLNPYGFSGVPPQDPYVYKEALSEVVHMADAANDNRHMIILSYLEDGISRFASYDYVGTMGIDNTLEFEGYPLDFQVPAEGNIYVLTY